VRVDSHCHVSDVWYEPAETLLFQMDRCGMDRAVLVQLLGQFDNRYQQACVKAWPDRFASVVAVDPAAPDAVETLTRLQEDGACGVRLRPQARSPGEDPLAIWLATQTLGLPVSCVGPASAFRTDGFAEVLAAVPNLKVVIEHLGGVARPDADDRAEEVFALAAHSNVYLKAPGLGQLASRAASLTDGGPPLPPSAAAPLMRALDAFGADRLMWGSDFPPVASREGYANAIGWVEAALSERSSAERADIFGGVAAHVFGLS
jgi:L-fuconolactonase